MWLGLTAVIHKNKITTCLFFGGVVILRNRFGRALSGSELAALFVGIGVPITNEEVNYL